MNALRIDTTKTRAVIFDMNGTMVTGSYDTFKAVEGLTDFLHLLRSHNVLLALATRAYKPEVDTVLSSLGIEGVFDAVATGEEIDFPKPHPQIYQRLLKQLELPASQALVFEDTPSGIHAAQAAGISVVGITTNYPAEILQKSGVVACLTNFRPVFVI